MQGLTNLNARLKYRGGARVTDRMDADKLRSLKQAMFNSYQAATAILEDEREFRCLINPNKMSNDLDDKIISIPFEDICLNKPKVRTTTEGIETIGLKPGDVFQWKENGSHWIVTLQYKTETAYFRAQCRECKEQIELNDKKYWCYVRGPVENTILWSQVNGDYFNKLNYTLIMYVTKNEETEAFFHRFSKIKIAGKPWEVQAIDNISMEGLIEVALKETFQNTIEEKMIEEKKKIEAALEPPKGITIIGDKIVRSYDIKNYIVKDLDNRKDIILNGEWKVDNLDVTMYAEAGSKPAKARARILKQDKLSCSIEILSAKNGRILLRYIDGNKEYSLPIEIKSL